MSLTARAVQNLNGQTFNGFGALKSAMAQAKDDIVVADATAERDRRAADIQRAANLRRTRAMRQANKARRAAKA